MIVQLPVEFRLCAEDDLRALEWMGLHSTQREIIRDTFDAQKRGDSLMLLAISGGFPVGQVWLDFNRDGGAKRPLLWAMRVFPPLQGRGIGGALIRRAEALAQSRGAEEIELGVEWDNEGARRFYERLGYQPCGSSREEVKFMFEGQPMEMTVDQQIMRKRLRSPESAL
jgi:ribosomal protein S18 acetylase RimI-like enzyme